MLVVSSFIQLPTHDHYGYGHFIKQLLYDRYKAVSYLKFYHALSFAWHESFSLRQPIPAFPIPLRTGEQKPMLELQPLLHQVYDRARLELAIDYNQPCTPKLSTEDEAWLRSLMS